ncbi:HAD family hydrolase [Candidatus Gottesmanbacteria bacterium]|nr:HAD family hydrolase [Candidatus Gottesmanbacteria bacterium]
MTSTVLEPRLASPELSGAEKVNVLVAAVTSIALQKSRLSPTTNGRALTDIVEELRLGRIIPNPDSRLSGLGVNVGPGTVAMRKADVVTTLAAVTVLQECPQHDVDAKKTAALLLTTNYAPRAELKAVVETARLQDNAEGKKTDQRLAGERLGSSVLRQMEAGRVDRLLAATVAVYAEGENLSVADAVDIARSLATHQPPAKLENAVRVASMRIALEVAKGVRNSLPRVGLVPDDVPFHSVARVAIRAMEDAEKLMNPAMRTVLFRRLVEAGRIPDVIENLTDILKIVDQNPEIRAVSFDLYDTLVQWTEDFGDRYGRYPHRALKHFRSAGINISEDQLRSINDRVWYERWANFQAHGNEVPLDDTLKDLISKVTQNQSLSAEEKTLLQKNLTREWYKLELENAVAMPGARETLNALKKRGIKICLTSNASWSKEHIHRVLNRFGLLEYFDAVSISLEIGKMKKPNVAELFHHSWNKLGLPYGSVLHIGDNANDDVVGARNAGARATHYNNPLAYNRLEVDKVHGNIRFVRDQNFQLYADTVVHMQKQSLEASTNEWMKDKMEQKNISKEERERLFTLAKEMYLNAREVYAPLYINMADKLLRSLNLGEADLVFALARDGLPLSAALKLLLYFDAERYPNVRSNQIHYIHSSRALLKQVVNPTAGTDIRLRELYLKYLGQKSNYYGKRIILTDIVSGEGNNYRLLREFLIGSLKASEVKGLFLDVLFSPDPNKRSFLQESVGLQEPILKLDTLLFHLESIFNGPHTTTKNFFAINTKRGTVIIPQVERKKLPPHVLVRGISEQGVLFLNEVAMRGVMDAARVRHRAHIAGLPDPSDKDVALRFIRYLASASIDDLRRTVPWQDGTAWFLPSQNEFEDERIAKKNILLRLPK